jgi:hypothetical protein
MNNFESILVSSKNGKTISCSFLSCYILFFLRFRCMQCNKIVTKFKRVKLLSFCYNFIHLTVMNKYFMTIAHFIFSLFILVNSVNFIALLFHI